MCEDFGIDSEAAAALAEQVELLRPNAERMSTSEDVAERLAQAIEGPFGSRNKLIKPRGTGSDCDLADADGKRDLTKLPLGDILKSEQELLYALIINERIKGGFEARATQHDSLGRMLMAEFVRRHHLHETWRHMVPKRFLPLIAALIVADVEYDHIKPNSALLNALLKAIVTWSEGRNAADVKRNKTPPFMVREMKALQEAAEKTEEELLATMREGFATSPAPEDFAAMQNRLAEKIRRHQQELAQLGEGSGPQIDDAAVAELHDRLGNLVRIEELGGAIDQGERVVFPSLEAVAAALRQPLGNRIEDQIPMADGPVEMNASTQVEALEEPPVIVSQVESEAKLDRLEQPQPDSVLTCAAHELSEPDRTSTSLDQAQPVTGEPDNVSETVSDDAILTEEPPELAPPLPPLTINELPRLGLIELRSDWDAIRPRLPRAFGISRSRQDDAFAGWHWNRGAQSAFPPLRQQRDPIRPDGEEGELELNDWLRIEVGPGKWRMAKPSGWRPIPAELCGFAHEFMLPPHSSTEWYGKQLGWVQTNCDILRKFGSPANPATVKVGGMILYLQEAFRRYVKKRMQDFEAALANGEIGRNLEPKDFFFLRGPDAKAFFAESFARYWIFILFARHNQEEFDRALGQNFFHGVIGPDPDVHWGGASYSFDSKDRSFVQVFDPGLIDKGQCSGSELKFDVDGVRLEDRQPFLSTIFVVDLNGPGEGVG